MQPAPPPGFDPSAGPRQSGPPAAPGQPPPPGQSAFPSPAGYVAGPPPLTGWQQGHQQGHQPPGYGFAWNPPHQPPPPPVGAPSHPAASVGAAQPVPSSGPGLVSLLGPASVLVVLLGLFVPFDSSNAWSAQIAWAIFAQLAALTAAAPVLLTSAGRSADVAWRVGAVGSVALAGYWLLVVLPSVGTNEGFVLTVGAALAVCGSWFSPDRPSR